MRHPDGFEQDRVIQERFAALKVDPFYCARFAGLIENLADLLQRESTVLLGAPPDKTVVTFKITAIRQENVKT